MQVVGIEPTDYPLSPAKGPYPCERPAFTVATPGRLTWTLEYLVLANGCSGKKVADITLAEPLFRQKAKPDFLDPFCQLERKLWESNPHYHRDLLMVVKPELPALFYIRERLVSTCTALRYGS